MLRTLMLQTSRHLRVYTARAPAMVATRGMVLVPQNMDPEALAAAANKAMLFRKQPVKKEPQAETVQQEMAMADDDMLDEEYRHMKRLEEEEMASANEEMHRPTYKNQVYKASAEDELLEDEYRKMKRLEEAEMMEDRERV